MIQVPEDKLEQGLTNWVALRLRDGLYEGVEEESLQLLLRLSKVQMVQRHRGEEYPFIEEIKLSPEEYNLIDNGNWTESNNIEVRAYCLDLCSRRAKDKREIKRKASDAYLELYKTVYTSWYLVRSVIIRFYEKGKDQDYLNEIIRFCPQIHGTWLVYVSEKLAKDYHDNLDGYVATLEGMISNARDKHNWYDAIAILDALFALNRMPNNLYHLRRALLYEEDFDYRLATQTETTYNIKVDTIQDAHKEISKIKEEYPEEHKRIRDKMIEEQRVFAEKLSIFGAKVRDVIPDSMVRFTKAYLEKNPINDPVQLIATLWTIPFFTPSQVKNVGKYLVKKNPMLYISFGKSEAIGDKGQTLGKADTETSLKITSHKKLRNRIRYIVESLLVDYLKKRLPLDEESFETGFCNVCKVPYIEESRKVLWAKGIYEGCRDDYISAAHILMPQIERALVLKAQQYCEDLTNYEREQHDQINLEKALTALKPHLKGVLYDEFSFFLNDGADVNFRNRLAHGLMDPMIIAEEGLYLWWLAIKMVFCEKDIFKKS